MKFDIGVTYIFELPFMDPLEIIIIDTLNENLGLNFESHRQSKKHNVFSLNFRPTSTIHPNSLATAC